MFRKAFASGTVLSSVAFGAQIKGINDLLADNGGHAVRQELTNDGDIQYTGKLWLGNQAIDVVPDTGSFELVMLSDKCHSCGDNNKLFHSKKSKSLKEGDLETEQNYGSGSTESKEAYDNVKVGDLVAKGLMFWEVYDANMPLLAYSTFGGIFGLGPPSSTEKMARKDAEQVREDVKKMKADGVNVSSYWPIVDKFETVANFSKSINLWLETVEVQHFSVCLEKGNGNPGVVVYNDDTELSLFTKKIEAVDDLYWGARAGKIQLGAMNGGGQIDLGAGKDVQMILDTGTSLIAAPQQALDKIVDAMDEFTRISDGCNNLAQLPDLEFELGGEQFSLPPEAYMGEMDSNSMSDWNFEVMPHLKPMQEQFITRNVDVSLKPATFCAPLIMSMGDETMWILGMPFFRKYYTRFDLSRNSKDAGTIHFAEAGKKCTLSKDTDEMRTVVDEFRGIPMRVQPAKLLPPKQFQVKVQSIRS